MLFKHNMAHKFFIITGFLLLRPLLFVTQKPRVWQAFGLSVRNPVMMPTSPIRVSGLSPGFDPDPPSC